MSPGCVTLSSPVVSAGTGASIGSAGDVSAVCLSSSCFFRWYPPIASLLSSPVASAGAGASASSAGGMSAVCSNSSCFYR